MRIVSYNIWNGGRDGPIQAPARDTAASRLDLIVEVLQRARPDVLLLAECNGFERAQSAQLRRFERALGLRGALAIAASGYHLALLAPAAWWRDCRTLAEGFCHAAIEAQLQVHDTPLTLLGAHLDPFSPQARTSEAQALLARLRPATSTLLLGDLNALSPRDVPHYSVDDWPARYRKRHGCQQGVPDTAAIEALEAAGLVDLAAAAGVTQPTRPTQSAKPDVPRQRLDYIFASADIASCAERFAVLDGPDVQRASDHLPVLAELSALGPAEAAPPPRLPRRPPLP